jgi:ferredoxin-nitrite reductase/sulfite reductase (ferredoxin)
MSEVKVGPTLDPEVLKDIEWFQSNLQKYRGGELTEEEFRPLRLHMGVYGQRQGGETQMFRLKIPWGGLDGAKLRKIARLAREYGGGVAHATTRQNFQVHYIELDRIAEAMADVAEAGLISREACGNTIRNVVGDPLAGVCPEERFDVTPYADALVRYFLRHPAFQSLPRKFKISFSGCPQPCPTCGIDEPIAWLHDIGFVANIGEGRRGFEVWVGGGLGNTPRAARLLEPFTPENDFIRTAAAILTLFNAEGERRNRNRARIKFLVEKLGWEEFRRRVGEIRETLPREPLSIPELREYPETRTHEAPAGGADPRWLRHNVRSQKQAGFATVTVVLPRGDVSADQLDEVAAIADAFSDGFVRASPSQNLILRWVRHSNLPALHARLAKIGLAEPTAGTAQDVTSCPGASTCALAFTHSKNLAGALRDLMEEHRELFQGEPLSIKISGCPNSCGQHHVADIGFYGMARRIGEREVPAYQVMVGGGLTTGEAAFGTALGRVPARLAPEALKRLVAHFALWREPGERFRHFVARSGSGLGELIVDLVNVPGDPELARDIGIDAPFRSHVGPGECAR